MLRNAFILITVLIAAFAAPAAAQQRRNDTSTLAWRFDQKREMTYRVREKMTQKAEGPDKFDAKWDREFIYTDAVEDVDSDGKATIRRTFDEVRVRVDHSEEGKRDYDSTRKPDKKGKVKDEDDPLIRPFAVLVGKSFTFTVTPEGRVTKVDGYADIMREVTSSLSLGGDDGGFGALIGSMAAGSDEDYRRQIEQSFAILPGRPVKRGESWEIEVDQPIPLLGSMRQETTHTFAGGTRIQSRGEFKIVRDSNVPDALGEFLKVDLKEGSVSGTSEFDASLGLIRKSTMDTKFDFRIRAMGSDGMPSNMRQVIEQHATMELISG